MWKLQSDEMKYCFRAAAPPPPPPYFQESLVWPPRSYSCSFCRREFRSAQALGGHMNVHRRDRAKLKQSPPPPPPPHHQPQPTLIKPSDHEIIFMNYGGGEEGTQRRWGKQDETDFVENDVVCNCKRHKLMCSSTERCSSMEEIDLELRLGAPAVKVGRIS